MPDNTPEYIYFNPTPMPEFPGTNRSLWPMAFGRIAMGTPETPSYGGIIFRGGGQTAFDAIGERLDLWGDTTRDGTYFNEDYSSFHIDESKGMAATAHFSEVGSVELLLFLCKTQTPTQVAFFEDRAQIQHLFTDHQLGSEHELQPHAVQHTITQPGDTIVFDHRMPHVFRRVSETRKSKIAFVDW